MFCVQNRPPVDYSMCNQTVTVYGRALTEIEDITDPEVSVAISRRSFDGWSWAEVAQEAE